MRIERIVILIIICSLFVSCMNYVRYNFDKTINPAVMPSKIGKIVISRPFIRSSTELNIDIMVSDLTVMMTDIFEDMNFNVEKNSGVSYNIMENGSPKSGISFGDITMIGDDIADKKVLFLYLEYSTHHMEGYVFKRTWDAVYNSYVFKEVYEKKTVLNTIANLFFYDAEKDELIFEKTYSSSDDISREQVILSDVIFQKVEGFIKNAFDDYIPKRQRVERFLIAK